MRVLYLVQSGCGFALCRLHGMYCSLHALSPTLAAQYALDTTQVRALTESREVFFVTPFSFSSASNGMYMPQHLLLLFVLPPLSFIYSPNVQGSPLIGILGTKPPQHNIDRSSTLELIPNPLAPFTKTSRWVSSSVKPIT